MCRTIALTFATLAGSAGWNPRSSGMGTRSGICASDSAVPQKKERAAQPTRIAFFILATSLVLETGAVKYKLPSSAEEGWPQHQKDFAKHPSRSGQGGADQ